MGADHVVVLADGHVAEEGTPEQLMERPEKVVHDKIDKK